MNPRDLMLLMQNPVSFALSRGFKLPPNTNVKSPKDMVMYLVNSGQVSQDALNQGQQMANSLGYKL